MKVRLAFIVLLAIGMHARAEALLDWFDGGVFDPGLSEGPDITNNANPPMVVVSNNSVIKYAIIDCSGAGTGIVVADGITGTQIYNVTIVNCTTGISIQSNAEIRNTVFENCTTDITENGGVATVSNNYASADGDPLFRSASDYHLRPGSPAINAGTDLCATLVTATDYEGKSVCTGGVFSGRGSAPEIGAYEYLPSTQQLLMSF